jgi:hypothetical protein
MKFRKALSTIMLSSLLFGTTACSNPVTYVIDKVTGPKTAEEVLQKSLEMSKKVKNYNVVMDMKQEMGLMGELVSMSVHSNAMMIMDPLTVHQTTKLTSSNGKDTNNQGISLNMDMYMTKDGFYMKDSTTKNWTHYTSKDFQALTGLQNLQDQTPSKQLDMIKKLIKNAKLIKKENQYVIQVNQVSDNDAEKFILKNFEQTVGTDKEMKKLVSKSLEIKKLDIELTFDKETFYPIEMDVAFDLSFAFNGQKTEVKQEVDTVYRNINKIQKFELPNEIKTSALEVKK